MAKTNLTERFCESARTNGKRVDYLDSKVPGLYFRVTPNGVKSWSLLYTDRRTSKKRRLNLGRYIVGQDGVRVEEREGITLARARQLAKEHIADIGQGADPARNVTLRRDSITFRQLAETKLEAMRATRRGGSRRSVTNYRSMLRRHVNPEIGDLKVVDITKADIKRVLDKVVKALDARFLVARDAVGAKRKRKGNPRILTPGRTVSHQANRVFEMLRSMIRFGVKSGLIDRSPMELMGRPVEVEAVRDRYLSLAEIPSFWHSLGTAPITRQLALAMMAEIVTGQRTGELMLRKKNDIDRTGTIPVLEIPRGDTKNKKKSVHRVPLSPLAMMIIDEAISITPESPFIFSSTVTDGPLTPQAATRALGRMRPNIEASDLRVHDLRRTASNGMRKLGVPKFIVSVVLNHVSVTNGDVTSEHYLDEYAYEPEKTEALLKWGAKLEEILGAAGLLQSSQIKPRRPSFAA